MRREPILVQETRFNLLPQRFLHRGVVRRVQRVERGWDVGARWGRHPGHYFRVRCQDGAVCDLFHDVVINAWYIKHTGSVLKRVLSSIGLVRRQAGGVRRRPPIPRSSAAAG